MSYLRKVHLIFTASSSCSGIKIQVARPEQQSLPRPIPDDEDVVAGLDGPAEPGVATQILRIGVVLDEAGEREVRTPGVRRLELPEPLNESYLLQPSEVVHGSEAKLQLALGRGPFDLVLPLGECAVVETAESRGRAGLHGTMGTRLRLDAIAREPV